MAWLSRTSMFGTSRRNRAWPSAGRSLVLVRRPVREEQRQLEGFRAADELELGSTRQRLRDVAPIESSAEAHISRALSRHEQMFARRSSPKRARAESGATPSFLIASASRMMSSVSSLVLR
jgi:hypothetical protein